MCGTGANGPRCPYERGFHGNTCVKPTHVTCPMMADEDCPAKSWRVVHTKLYIGNERDDRLVYLRDIIIECVRCSDTTVVTHVYDDLAK